MHPSNSVHDPWLGLVTLIASAADDTAPRLTDVLYLIQRRR